MASMKKMALKGIRVVDFSWAVMGPHCTLMLALIGAEVIKIESATRLDALRRPRPHIGQMEPSTFVDLLTNKRSVTVNLTQQRGTELVKEIIAQSDVVVESFRPGVMERLGLGYQILKKLRPDLLMISLSTSGAAGPDREAPGYAPIFAALSGLSYITGYVDGPPVEMRISMDHICGTTGAMAILAGLYHRHGTGEGQHIDMAAREVLSCLAGDALMDYTMNGRNASRRGNSDFIMAPHNCYRCQGEDQWVTIAVGSDDEWRALCKAMGRAELIDDPRFSDGYLRHANQDELDQAVEQWTRGLSDYQVMKTLQAAGVAAMPSFNLQQLVNDPHLKARDAFIEVEGPEGDKAVMVGPPWRLSETPAEVNRWTPLLGQDNQYVLGELLAKSRAELANLAEEKVLQ